MKTTRLLPILICVCLTISLLSGCSASLEQAPSSTDSESPTPSSNTTPPSSLSFASNYSDIFAAISNTLSYSSPSYGAAYDTIEVREEAGAIPAADVKSDSEINGSDDYSQTNVQVDGIDEGDIVKTDGSYIYVLREDELIIFKADGASTIRISTTKVASSYSDDTYEEQYDTWDYASDIYVTGNTAVVILSRYSLMPYTTESSNAEAYSVEPFSIDKQISMLRIYDISDRTNPMQKAEFGQDGYVLTTRLIGSTLFMISTYYVYDAHEEIDGTYIPSIYNNGTAELIKASDIAITPYFDSSSYTVVCAYDLEQEAINATQSILGGGSTVYMNTGKLYIAESTSQQTTGEPYTHNMYTVTDYTTTNITNITSFDITDGNLSLDASGTVPGSLYNQFNMDEYNGNLRVVTTTYTQSWSEYTDEEMGWTNYVWGDGTTSNSLFVLDSSLNIIGNIDTLAEDEQVYGVRFDGDTGYIVTFRQVDPLFAVDLSNPTNPTVLSALKIPGFSEYLHVYSDGRLFGLGMDADEETGWTDGLKLTMFDTSNPQDVTVKHSLKLEAGYSVALYNHKAILISADKALIAFPVENGYDIYGYSDDTGFYKQASIDTVEWYGNGRGMYIGDYAYIVTSSTVTVLDLTDFMQVSQLEY